MGPNPTDFQLRAYFSGFHISEQAQAILRTIWRAAPYREPSSGEGESLKSLHFSPKVHKSAPLESNAERIHALSLDVDPDVVTYRTQARCVGVRAGIGASRFRTISITADTIVLAKSGPRLVEVKPTDVLEKLASARPWRWGEEAGLITDLAMVEWCRVQGIAFQIWSPPLLPGVYLNNLELLREALNATHEARSWQNKRLFESARLTRERLTIRDALEICRLPNAIPILAALAARELYGPLKYQSLSNIDKFRITTSTYENELLERHLEQRYLLELGELERPSRILTCTESDLARGRMRLARIRTAIENRTPLHPRDAAVAKAVEDALLKGDNPLEATITNTHRSGNRSQRLSDLSERIIEHCIDKYWLTQRLWVYTDVHDRIELIGQRLHLDRVCSLTTVWKRCKAVPVETVAKAKGGQRLLNREKAASDPRTRTIPAEGSYLRVHIDSSKFDSKNAYNILGDVSFPAPTLYVICDSHEQQPLAHALIVGSPSRKGVAIAIRDFVRRNGRLPRAIIIDRGPDLKNSWLRSFCEKMGIDLIVVPRASPRTNSLAENTIKRVNQGMAWRLKGSTLPDKAGRSVDPSFKSIKQKKIDFTLVSNEIERLLYSDIGEIPTSSGQSPNERRQDSLERLGKGEITSLLDSTLVLATSIKVDRFKLIHQKGIRTKNGTYNSDALVRIMRESAPELVLEDCETVNKIYVKFKGIYVTAFHQSIQSLVQDTLEESTARQEVSRSVRASTKQERDRVRRRRNVRISNMNAMAESEPTRGVSRKKSSSEKLKIVFPRREIARIRDPSRVAHDEDN